MKRALCVLCLFAVTCSGQQLADVYAQVAHPTLKPGVAVENLDFAWDALSFSLTSGVVAIANPVQGHSTLAVFSGSGKLSVKSPNPIESQQAKFFRGKPDLQEEFTAAVFRFADSSAFVQALGAGLGDKPALTDSSLAPILDERAKQVTALGDMRAARILLALSESQPSRLFMAELKLADGHWIDADYDPWDREPVWVSERIQKGATGTSVLQDTWEHFTPAGAPAYTVPVHLDNYKIGVEIPKDLTLNGTASFSAQANRSASGLLLDLVSNLRVSSVTGADGTPLPYIQPPDPGRERDPWYQGDWLYVQLPQPLSTSGPTAMTIKYAGKGPIDSVGNGNFFCESFGWYPTTPYEPVFQRASYELQFKVQKGLTVVATGVKNSDTVDGALQVTTWKSPIPLTVAGFAFGDYSEIKQTIALAGGQNAEVQVFSNNRPDDRFDLLNHQSNDSEMAVGNFDVKVLADRSLANAATALKFFSTYFGPYPYPQLALTNIPADYGQGWPGLLYLDELGTLDSTQLHALTGIPPDQERFLTFGFRAHEVSHQWWGHRVSWASYHDQWLSEGFAEGSAMLYEEALEGRVAMMQTIAKWRLDLESKDRFGWVPDDDGALWLGNRLWSSIDPFYGYTYLTYDKGGYVLYMIRQMMLDTTKTGTQADAAFIEMMRDFTSTYADKAASTEDFKAIVEKHMTRPMNLDGNGKMDWFFNEYVYGTGIPAMTFHAASAPGDAGKYKVTLTLKNPTNWKVSLPVYLFQDDTHYTRIQLPVTQADINTTFQVPFNPKKIIANYNQDMLVDISQ